MAINMKEQVLAEKVIDYLHTNNWEVYQEVYVGRVADIVAVKHNLSWIIECKTSASLKVIEQAYAWNGYANYISVATPSTNYFFNKVLLQYGIGSICMDSFDVYIINKAKFERRLFKKDIKKYLCEEQKTYAKAGNNERKVFTPFIKTKIKIQEYIRNNNGCTLKQLVEEIEHHYSSDQTAKQNIVKFILDGVIDGINIVKDGKHVKLFKNEQI